MYSSLRNRVVIVTGAGRGFGRLIALALIAQGARVVGTASRSREELDVTAKSAGADHFLPLIADVANHQDCERVRDATIATFGRIDVLINNAARGPMEADQDFYNTQPKFWATPPDAYRRMVETNFIGAFNMASVITPHLVASGFGRIVNLSTSNPTMVMQGMAAYGASKAALEAATATWAKDLEGTGVTANALLPGGPCDTAFIPGGGFGARSLQDFQPGKGMKGDQGRAGGILPPEVIVPPALWLCSDESNGTNGRRLVAKDWDPQLPSSQAAAQSMTPVQHIPAIM